LEAYENQRPCAVAHPARPRDGPGRRRRGDAVGPRGDQLAGAHARTALSGLQRWAVAALWQADGGGTSKSGAAAARGCARRREKRGATLGCRPAGCSTQRA
jgi:hypothetical protein